MEWQTAPGSVSDGRVGVGIHWAINHAITPSDCILLSNFDQTSFE